MALQKTHTEKIKLPGYSTLAHILRMAILVKKTITVQVHKIADSDIEHTMVEILPTRKNQKSLYIANLYSPPREQLHHYDVFVRELCKRINGNRLIVVGDFKPHMPPGATTTPPRKGHGFTTLHSNKPTPSRLRPQPSSPGWMRGGPFRMLERVRLWCLQPAGEDLRAEDAWPGFRQILALL
ncbi:hypothetical protein HPB51_019371 [Rhipicephalus microplus]|uniref:Endonuclease/exonuclease/phosphatase domain-containing protein n=1 Tax=Rhipicephalus microplus TaxID=6941 RepID=A0A9J6DC56_RHIMP|nr:hypothetical protein HPB51_019371 [Rhipicephalus microplus]